MCLPDIRPAGRSPLQEEAAMSPRLRKFIGTVVLIVCVPIYALIVMTIAVAVLPGAAWWAQGLFYLIGGLIWVLPAGLLVTWMVRPRR